MNEIEHNSILNMKNYPPILSLDQLAHDNKLSGNVSMNRDVKHTYQLRVGSNMAHKIQCG